MAKVTLIFSTPWLWRILNLSLCCRQATWSRVNAFGLTSLSSDIYIDLRGRIWQLAWCCRRLVLHIWRRGRSRPGIQDILGFFSFANWIEGWHISWSASWGLQRQDLKRLWFAIDQLTHDYCRPWVLRHHCTPSHGFCVLPAGRVHGHRKVWKQTVHRICKSMQSHRFPDQCAEWFIAWFDGYHCIPQQRWQWCRW